MTFNYELVALWLHKETENMPITIYDIARAKQESRRQQYRGTERQYPDQQEDPDRVQELAHRLGYFDQQVAKGVR